MVTLWWAMVTLWWVLLALWISGGHCWHCDGQWWGGDLTFRWILFWGDLSSHKCQVGFRHELNFPWLYLFPGEWQASVQRLTAMSFPSRWFPRTRIVLYNYIFVSQLKLGIQWHKARAYYFLVLMGFRCLWSPSTYVCPFRLTISMPS